MIRLVTVTVTVAVLLAASACAPRTGSSSPSLVKQREVLLDGEGDAGLAAIDLVGGRLGFT